MPISDRLIPAHAGKTGVRRWCPGGAGAHPRSRGENFVPQYLHGAIMGSSPLTRGKSSGERPTGISSGLIPAHAGKISHTT